MAFRVKICGITRVADAVAVVQAGGDAIGLNFYPHSPRYVAPQQSRAIVAAVGDGVVKVGLFVNAPQEQVCEVFDQLRLDMIQLHGDEPPEYLTGLGGRPVMRALRVGQSGLESMLQYLQDCRRLVCLPQLTLIDSCVPGQYGGTGKAADWDALRTYPSEEWHPPLVLAGGLTPANVAAAIAAVRPIAVDTASGVEVSPGRKDPAAVVAFVRAALAALKGNSSL